MAKPTTVKIRLNSTADTDIFMLQKNARTMTEKMLVKKYDPVARKHVEYKEGKINKKAAIWLFITVSTLRQRHILYFCKLSRNMNILRKFRYKLKAPVQAFAAMSSLPVLSASKILF